MKGLRVPEPERGEPRRQAWYRADRHGRLAGRPYLVVTSNGQFKLTGAPYNVAPYGIAIQKGSMMAKPVLDALKVLMANGTYRAILSRWYILSGAIKNPQINGAIS